MNPLARAGRSALLVLGTGYVLCFFSETVFWSMWRPDEDLIGRVSQWLLYSLFGYLTLAVIHHFRVRSVWSLALAGAFFGWIDEGVVAMTVYGDSSMPFPITIAWTALAWHAPVSVVLGWYALGMALRRSGIVPVVVLSLGLGVFWGVWGLGWMAETPPVAVEPLAFFAHAVVTTTLLGAAYWAIAAGATGEYRASRSGTFVAGAALCGFFALVTVPTVPIAAAVLPLLLGLLALVLWRQRAPSEGPSLTADFSAPIRFRNLAAMALMPLSASLVYAAAPGALPLIGLIHPVAAVVGVVGGTAVFGVAVVKALLRHG